MITWRIEIKNIRKKLKKIEKLNLPTFTSKEAALLSVVESDINKARRPLLKISPRYYKYCLIHISMIIV